MAGRLRGSPLLSSSSRMARQPTRHRSLTPSTTRPPRSPRPRAGRRSLTRPRPTRLLTPGPGRPASTIRLRSLPQCAVPPALVSAGPRPSTPRLPGTRRPPSPRTPLPHTRCRLPFAGSQPRLLLHRLHTHLRLSTLLRRPPSLPSTLSRPKLLRGTSRSPCGVRLHTEDPLASFSSYPITRLVSPPHCNNPTQMIFFVFWSHAQQHSQDYSLPWIFFALNHASAPLNFIRLQAREGDRTEEGLGDTLKSIHGGGGTSGRKRRGSGRVCACGLIGDEGTTRRQQEGSEGHPGRGRPDKQSGVQRARRHATKEIRHPRCERGGK